MNITITLTPSESLIALVQSLVGPVPQPLGVKVPEKITAPPKKETPKVETAAETVTAAGDDKITLESLRAIMDGKRAEGKTAGIKALLKKFNVDRLTALSTDQYADFKTEAVAL